MNWDMSEEELHEAVDTTELSIGHHRVDVLQELEAGREVSFKTISGDECALCRIYHGAAWLNAGDEEIGCAACPLYRMGYGCENNSSPWQKLKNTIWLADRHDYFNRAIEASKAMITALEATRDELQCALDAVTKGTTD